MEHFCEKNGQAEGKVIEEKLTQSLIWWPECFNGRCKVMSVKRRKI